MKTVLDYHDRLIDNNGIYNSTGFSMHGQQTRFEIILSQIKKPCASVLDYGCNVGDIYPVIIHSHPECEYLGVDINFRMIEVAKSRFWSADFECGDILDQKFRDSLPQYQYVIASGIFCYNCGSDAKELNYNILERLWSVASDTLIFNMLKSSKTGNLTYKVDEALEYVRQFGCESYSILNDYLQNDFTVVMRKGWTHSK